jgi:hypothetical protein
MDGYLPLIECEKCGTRTRHHPVGTERRFYQCVEDRVVKSKSEQRRIAAQSAFDALIYACGVCGTKRGYGNRAL